VAKVSECAQELIEGVRRVRKEGGNPYEYLASLGVTVSDLRKYLIDCAKKDA
jgi:hypothetical protein